MAQIESLTTDAIIALINAGTWPQNFTPVAGGLVLVGDQVAADVSLASSLLIHLKNTGSLTLAAGTYVFEGSIDSTNGTDGTWFSVQASRTSNNTVESSNTNPGLAAGVGLVNAWKVSVLGYKWFRVRTTVASSASSIAFFTLLRGAYAAEPTPNVQSHGITGTVAATTATANNYGLISAASTNAAVIKNAAGHVFELSVFNPTAALIYVKLYNKTTAPTVGTDVPIITFPVPVNGSIALEFGALGKRFVTGIAIALTAGPLATDTVAVAAGAQISASYL